MTTSRRPGALETAHAESGSLANVVAFHSLSKRSGLPGLRSGFVAGDPEFIAAFGRFRNVACPQVPLPVQHVSAKAWADERHVEEGRALYRRNFAIAGELLKGRYGYRQARGELLSLAKYGAFSGAGRRPRKPFGKGVVSECCRELISHKPNPMASIRARTTSGSRSCKTRTPHARP